MDSPRHQAWRDGTVRLRRRATPGIGVTGLARAIDVHQSTASKLVKGLQERELILAERSGSVRRTVSLHATAA